MAGDEGRKFLLVVEERDTRDSEAGGLTERLPCLGAWSALAPLLNTRMLHPHFRKHLVYRSFYVSVDRYEFFLYC